MPPTVGPVTDRFRMSPVSWFRFSGARARGMLTRSGDGECVEDEVSQVPIESCRGSRFQRSRAASNRA